MADERTLLRPRWVYTGTGRIRTGTAVLVEGRRIAALLPADQPVDARTVDLPESLLIPGLINTHTHVGAGPVGRGISEDYELPSGMPFYVPLSRLWRRAYEERYREAFRSVMAWDTVGMLMSGTTTIVNHASTDVIGYLDIAARLGVRTWTGPTIPLDVTHRLGQLDRGAGDGSGHRPDTTGADAQAAELAILEDLFTTWDGAADGRISMLLGPAAVHTDDFSLLEATARAARRLDCLVTTHLCQSTGELVETERRFGTTPLRVLERAGLANDRLIAAHATYLPETDLDLAAGCGITVAHCATRKAKEALVSASQRFRDAGIRVTLGTDGFSCDLITELGYAATLGKIGVGRVHSPSTVQTLDAATATAATALHRDDLGVIGEGAVADLVAVGLGSPALSPVFDPVQTLVMYGTGRDVDLVMVDGIVRVQDGQVPGVDLAALRASADAAMQTIWADARSDGLIDEVLTSTSRGR